MKKFLLSMLAFVAMAVSAAEVQVTFNGTGTSWTSSAAEQTETKDGVTLAVENGLYNGHYRFYKGKTVTISSTVGTIKSVEFTCTAEGDAQYGPGCFDEASTGTYAYEGNVGTWTGINATSATIVPKTNQVRATQVVVTYEVEGELEPTVTADVNEVYFWNYDYIDANPSEYYYCAFTNSKTITVTENNFEENIPLNAVMKSSGKATGSYLENRTRFSVSGTVFTSGNIKVMTTSKAPGIYEDAILLKNGSDVYLEIPVKMVIVGTSDKGCLDDDGNVWPLNVADAYAIHEIMPAGGNYYTDPTHEWSMYSPGERYFKGIVAEVKEISTQYGNATFYIKDADGDQKLQIFRTKGFNNEAITDENIVAVGQEVIVVGELCDYNGTPEIKNGYLYSVTGVADAITNVESTQTTDAIYNIAGQRVNNNAKGILIINGKKVIK